MCDQDVSKIFKINTLIRQVVINTLKEVDGKKGDLKEEKRWVKEVLFLTLGRSPTQNEIGLAMSERWPIK
jgi:hypothetical protein